MEQENDMNEGGEIQFRKETEVEHYQIVFSSANGDEIAKIDVRTGEVTYKAPEAGKDAAGIFWLCFRDRIMENIEKMGVKDLILAAEEVQKYLKDFGERKAGIGGVWGPLGEMDRALKKVKGED